MLKEDIIKKMGMAEFVHRYQAFNKQTVKDAYPLPFNVANNRYGKYTEQKHPRCKKSDAKSETPVSSYPYIQLKNVIST